MTFFQLKKRFGRVSTCILRCCPIEVFLSERCASFKTRWKISLCSADAHFLLLSVCRRRWGRGTWSVAQRLGNGYSQFARNVTVLTMKRVCVCVVCRFLKRCTTSSQRKATSWWPVELWMSRGRAPWWPTFWKDHQVLYSPLAANAGHPLRLPHYLMCNVDICGWDCFREGCSYAQLVFVVKSFAWLCMDMGCQWARQSFGQSGSHSQGTVFCVGL